MKRYMLFFGRIYYPSGGIDDLIGFFDNVNDAKKAYDDKLLEGFDADVFEKYEYFAYQKNSTWAHIYDTHECKIIWEA